MTVTVWTCRRAFQGGDQTTQLTRCAQALSGPKATQCETSKSVRRRPSHILRIGKGNALCSSSRHDMRFPGDRRCTYCTASGGACPGPGAGWHLARYTASIAPHGASRCGSMTQCSIARQSKRSKQPERRKATCTRPDVIQASIALIPSQHYTRQAESNPVYKNQDGCSAPN